eukprot:GCRY01002024.1.p1 GENE.GCRY01002024.1~~GCRY01002024.1.p1  ORF type:complete len:883 (+),score=260.03 GCRY01002024.1:139-2787(+)
MREKKDEDEVGHFSHLEKSAVLQEARAFNETPINARKCCLVSTKILALLYNGEVFTNTEATDLFFSITKLFQSNDKALRRLMYLLIKELSKTASDVIIVTSSLTKDMNTKVDIYRANALRTLVQITEPSMLQAIERFIKQSLVDSVPFVSSAALVSAVHLMNINQDVVRRWLGEIQEGVVSDDPMVQYHALGLLHMLRKGDKLAVAKLISQISHKTKGLSPYSASLLVRFAVDVLNTIPLDSPGTTEIVALFNKILKGSDLAALEACRAVTNLNKGIPESLNLLTTVLARLKTFLSSVRPTVCYGALRTLLKLSQDHSSLVSVCNPILETLITSSNKIIATLAISILMKCGSESSIDHLMKQIRGMMGDINDDFKLVVLDAVKALCFKYPQKHRLMLNFMTTVLREEGGFSFKSQVVDVMIALVEKIPEAKEKGLEHLCEFIEDCEYSLLCLRVLHFLSLHGIHTSNPTQYLRHIYNRIILENPMVRAAAVTTLAEFGLSNPSLKPNVIVLLRRCRSDSDDEVRDRAVFYLGMLEQARPDECSALLEEFGISIDSLEHSLKEYLASEPAEAFDLATVPKLSVAEQKEVEERAAIEAKQEETAASILTADDGSDATKRTTMFEKLLASIPETADAGSLLKSSAPVELTESETEYGVTCIKHVFANDVVFHFAIKNTLEDIKLKNVCVNMECDAEGLELRAATVCESVEPGKEGTCYVRWGFVQMPTAVFTSHLDFQVAEIDPTTGEEEEGEPYDDEYALEDVMFGIGDLATPLALAPPQFKALWDELGQEHEVVEAFALGPSVSNITKAVELIPKVLGLGIIDGARPKDAVSPHSLQLAGVVRGERVAVLARLIMPSENKVALKLGVRSSNTEISRAVTQAIA